MAKKYNNIIETGAGFKYTGAQPLDDRDVVEQLADLTALDNSNLSYEGQDVYVIAKNASFKKIGNNWVQTATIEDIQELEDSLPQLIADQTTAAMEFKGATASLPTTGTNGDMYKVSGSFEVSDTQDAQGKGFTTQIGDSIVCDTQGKWYLIPSGDDIENTWRPVTDVDNNATLTFASGDKIDVTVAANGTVTYKHVSISNPELLAENEQTRTYITEVETDGFGHITGYKTATENVEDTTYETATADADGLMSKEHFSKVESVSEGANKVETLVDLTDIDWYSVNGKIKIDGEEKIVYQHPESVLAGSLNIGLHKFSTDADGHVDNSESVTAEDIADLGVAITDTIYTHPEHTAYESGIYKVTIDTEGHVSDAKAVTKSDLDGLIGNATVSDSGLMSQYDKEKLDVIEAGAEANVIESIKIGDTAATIDGKTVTLGSLAGKSAVGMEDLGADVLGEINDIGGTAREAKDTADNTLSIELPKKADKATTLAGYEISDAYTKTEVDKIAQDVRLPITRSQFNQTGIVFNEGVAQGEYSIAGGTTDKEFIEGVVGSTAASITTLHKSEARGPLSIALGADNVSNTAGSVTMGYDNISGGKGYYFDDFNGNTITLSTTRRATTLVNPSYPTSIDWAVGDRLFMVNDDRVWLTITAVDGNKVTVAENIGSVQYESILTVFTYSKPNDRTIINIDKPESGVVDIGWGAFGIGTQNTVVGSNSYAVGYKNTIAGDFSSAFGQENIVGYSAFATGVGNQALGKAAFASGDNTEAVGSCSHTEGHGTIASANYAHAEGYKSVASNQNAHAEGIKTTAGGYASHAEGSQSKATNEAAHAEGLLTEATGPYSHAEGSNSKATARDTHAEGHATLASASYAHSGGLGTIASAEAQTAIGKYNKENNEALFIVGNGSVDARSNAFEVLGDGKVCVNGGGFQAVQGVADPESNYSIINIDSQGATLGTQVGSYAGTAYVRTSYQRAILYAGGGENLGTVDRLTGGYIEVNCGTVDVVGNSINLKSTQHDGINLATEADYSDITLTANQGNVVINAKALKIGDVELTAEKLQKIINFIDTIEGGN